MWYNIQGFFKNKRIVDKNMKVIILLYFNRIEDLKKQCALHMTCVNNPK